MTFLDKVSNHLITKHETFENLVVVTPNNRTNYYLKTHLKGKMASPNFLPQFFSIEEFGEDLAGVTILPKNILLFEFYQVYQLITREEEKEDFLSFSNWASIVLNDFNDIDLSLIEKEQIFPYLKAIKEINSHWSFDENKTELQINYLKFWNKLGDYYTTFTEHLIEKRIGYQGLVFRKALAKLKDSKVIESHYIFVGFNALSESEQSIIRYFLDSGNADIIWDIDEHFLNEKNSNSAYFINKYKNEWRYYKTEKINFISKNFMIPKDIELVTVQNNEVQLRYIKKFIKNKTKNTAIVLGDQALLNPLHIAIGTQNANFSKGRSISDEPIIVWLKSVIKFFSQPENERLRVDLEEILNNPITLSHLKDKKRVKNLIEKSLYTLEEDELIEIYSNFSHQLKSVFIFELGTLTAINLITSLANFLQEEIKEKLNSELETEVELIAYQELQAILNYSKVYDFLNDLSNLLIVFDQFISVKTRELSPIIDEEGLQIMGFFESRNLDFDTVLITDVNENILPFSSNMNSYIPNDIKAILKIQTPREKDLIYTYHFFRLIQRAKKVILLYKDSNDSGISKNEKSRFIYQLEYLYRDYHTISYKNVYSEASVISNTEDVFEKDELLIEDLKKLLTRGISPTGLSIYIRESMSFFEKKVLKIEPKEESEVYLSNRIFGIIIHNTLEILYKPIIGKRLTKEDLIRLNVDKDAILETMFVKEVYSIKGVMKVYFEMAKMYIEHVIDIDKKIIEEGHSLMIKELELSLNCLIEVADIEVNLTGKIDRIDELDGVTRIVDYKTGTINDWKKSVDIKKLLTDSKQDKAFQLLTYAYMYVQKFNAESVMATIYALKNKENKLLEIRDTNIITKETLCVYNEDVLTPLIERILDKKTPFTKKVDA